MRRAANTLTAASQEGRRGRGLQNLGPLLADLFDGQAIPLCGRVKLGVAGCAG